MENIDFKGISSWIIIDYTCDNPNAKNRMSEYLHKGTWFCLLGIGEGFIWVENIPAEYWRGI